MDYPCWRKRRATFPGVTVLRTPAEVAQADLDAWAEQQRELARLALAALTEEAKLESSHPDRA